MAAATAACKRVVPLGMNSRIGFCGFGANGGITASQLLSPALRFRYLDSRQLSELVKSNGKRLFLVDTLALVILFLSITLCLGTN